MPQTNIPSAKVQELLDCFPGPTRLEAARWKLWGFFGGSLFLLLLGISLIFMIFAPSTLRLIGLYPAAVTFDWVLTLQFGFLMLVMFGFGVLGLVLGGVAIAHHSVWIALDRAGFETENLWMLRRRVEWRDVSPFTLVKIGSGTVAYSDRRSTTSVGERILRALAWPFGNGLIPPVYVLRQDDFAALMNGWRERALAQSG